VNLLLTEKTMNKKKDTKTDVLVNVEAKMK
jgi:hypothetical protein